MRRLLIVLMVVIVRTLQVSLLYHFLFFESIDRLADDLDLRGAGTFVDGSDVDVDCKISIDAAMNTTDGLSFDASVNY